MEDMRYNYHADRKVDFSTRIKWHLRGYMGTYLRGALALGILAVPPTCNRIINSGTKETIDGKVISVPQQIYGHADLYIHDDGSREMIYFPGFRLGRVEIDQDRDGDGDIDVIKVNASEFRMNKMIHYFDAHKQYLEHKKTVDKANKRYHKFLEKNLHNEK